MIKLSSLNYLEETEPEGTASNYLVLCTQNLDRGFSYTQRITPTSLRTPRSNLSTCRMRNENRNFFSPCGPLKVCDITGQKPHPKAQSPTADRRLRIPSLKDLRCPRTRWPKPPTTDTKERQRLTSLTGLANQSPDLSLCFDSSQQLVSPSVQAI